MYSYPKITFVLLLIACAAHIGCSFNRAGGLVQKMGVHNEAAVDEASRKLIAMGEDAVPALIQGLNDDNVRVRSRSAYTLGEIGPINKEVLPALINALRDKDKEVRGAAVEALGVIGPEKGVVKALTLMLKVDSSLAVRQNAAIALGEIGPVDDEVLPALVRALADEEVRVRDTVAEAIGGIGLEALPSLIEALGNKNPYIRQFAAEAIAVIGPDAVDAVHTLVNRLSDKDENVRRSAAWALGIIGPGAKAAVPKLRTAIWDDDLEVRSMAIHALALIGPESGVIYSLIKALEDGLVREDAVFALASFGSVAVDALINACDHRKPDVRISAVIALGMIGPDAKKALPKLRYLIEHDRYGLWGTLIVRELAVIAIESIEGYGGFEQDLYDFGEIVVE